MLHGHSDPVNCVKWVSSISHKQVLISGAVDHKVIVWKSTSTSDILVCTLFTGLLILANFNLKTVLKKKVSIPKANQTVYCHHPLEDVLTWCVCVCVGGGGDIFLNKNVISFSC